MLMSLLKQQEEILDSFINIQQYDKLLFYLESSLFSTAPTLICPSAFIIRILLTLATLGDYANADLIRKEFANSLSDRSLQKRALDILMKLIRIVKEKSPISDEPFSPPGYDAEDIEYAETQLINSLDFLVEDKKMKKLRARIFKKNYKEKKILEKHETERKKQLKTLSYPHKKDLDSTPSKDRTLQQEELEWSPQKRQMEREFAKLEEHQIGFKFDHVDDSDSDDNIDNTASRKSFKIFKNDRIDIALNESKIWNLISWALKCSLNDHDPISREIWNVWNPLLTLIIDILELEFDRFAVKKENGDDVTFEETFTYKFLNKVGRYNWGKKISEFILTNKSRKVLPIYSSETTAAKSLLIGNSIEFHDECLLVTPESGHLQRKLLFLAARVSESLGENHSISSMAQWSFDSLISEFTNIFREGKYNDLINFIQLNQKTLETSWKVYIIQEILLCYLIQLTTYTFESPSSPSTVWIQEKSSLEFIKELLQNVTFEKKYYISDNKLDFDKMLLDYNKLNFILYIMLKIWLVCSGYELSSTERREIISFAEVGEKSRLEVLKVAAKGTDENFSTDDLKSLSGWLMKDVL